MTSQTAARSIWEDHWSGEALAEQSVRKMVTREVHTHRWKATVRALRNKFGSVRGLRTIELGSGKGDVSLFLALVGAEVTLFDREEQAIERAQEQFGYYGLTPKAVVGDLLDIDERLDGQFDVAISWGVAEHFQRPAAFEVFLAHRRVIHDGGMVVISVPNCWSVPYRLNKKYKEMRGIWKWGLELPFSPYELKGIARRMGLKNVWVHGSPIIRDLDQFLFHPVMGRIEKYLGLRTEVRTPLDSLFGHALTLFGEPRA